MYEIIEDSEKALCIKYLKDGKPRFAANARKKGMQDLQTTEILLPYLVEAMNHDKAST